MTEHHAPADEPTCVRDRHDGCDNLDEEWNPPPPVPQSAEVRVREQEGATAEEPTRADLERAWAEAERALAEEWL
jgi:hypothetical protein